MATLPAGGGRRLTPDGNGDYTVTELPTEQPTEREHHAFTVAGYYALSHLELMRRLRTAEWNAEERKRQLDAHIEGCRYTRTEAERTVARVAGLVDVRRKTLRMHDLRLALNLIPLQDQ